MTLREVVVLSSSIPCELILLLLAPFFLLLDEDDELDDVEEEEEDETETRFFLCETGPGFEESLLLFRADGAG